MLPIVEGGAPPFGGFKRPEFLGHEEGCYLFVMKELAQRGVVFRETVE